MHIHHETLNYVFVKEHNDLLHSDTKEGQAI